MISYFHRIPRLDPCRSGFTPSMLASTAKEERGMCQVYFGSQVRQTLLCAQQPLYTLTSCMCWLDLPSGENDE